MDGSVFTTDDVNNFPDDGSPLEDTLWNLSLSADGPLGSTSDVDVDFELNPLAFNEILLPSSYLSKPAGILGQPDRGGDRHAG